MSKTVVTLFLFLAISLGFVSLAYAENDDSNKGKSDEAEVQELKGHIKKLHDQIKAMIDLRGSMMDLNKQRKDADTRDEKKEIKNQMVDIRADMKDARGNIKAEMRFIRSLVRGMSGDDVEDLQEMLAQDPDIYPEGLITGFFGPATERALKKFQAKHGIESIGVFGPKTRARLLALFEGRWPPGLAKRLGIFASTSATTTPGGMQITLCHIPPGNPAGKHTITVGLAAFAAHLLHGDKLGACDGGDMGTTTPPVADTTAPVISGISATSTASTTSTIVWTTNENADSTVWYGTTTPLVLTSPTLSVSNSSLAMSHSVNLSGLSASTTQYFVVNSKDAAGNTATSSEQSFSTLP